MTTESLTYKQLASRLGVKLESARKTVQRKRWQRVTGNDGVVRVMVPIDVLPQSMDSPSDGPNDRREDSPAFTIRELQMKVEALQELLSVERQRATAAEIDRDRWHAEAVKPWWRKMVG